MCVNMYIFLGGDKPQFLSVPYNFMDHYYKICPEYHKCNEDYWL